MLRRTFQKIRYYFQINKAENSELYLTCLITLEPVVAKKFGFYFIGFEKLEI